MPPGSGPEKSLYDDAVTFFSGNIVQQNVGGKAVVGNLGSFVLQADGQGRTYDGNTCGKYKMVLGAGANAISAYWCPYADDEVNALTLTGESHLMFTAKMNGCSFGIGIPAGDGAVRVAHANISTNDRLDQLLQDSFAESVKGKNADPKTLDRIASARLQLRTSLQRDQLGGGSGVGALSTALEPNLYRNMSTTTFGVRTGTVWKFYFQIYQTVGTDIQLFGCFPFPS